MIYNAKIIKVADLQQGVSNASGREWKKRSVNVEIPDNDEAIVHQVKHVIQVSFSGEEAVAAGAFAVGDEVVIRVGFGLRQYKDSEFPICYGWSIEKAATGE